MKTALAASGIELGIIALRLGVTTRAFNHYFNDRSEPRLEMLLEFCSVVGVSIGELLDFDPEHPEVDEIKIVNENTDLVKIDVIDAYLSAGAGVENLSENVIGQLAFSTHLLDRMGVKPSAAKIIQVNGSEMAPTLPNGSWVMVDLRDKQPTSQSVLFAYRSDKEVVVKYLEYFKAGEMLVRSSNPTLPTKLYPIQSDDLEILGRVVWSCQVWPESK